MWIHSRVVLRSKCLIFVANQRVIIVEFVHFVRFCIRVGAHKSGKVSEKPTGGKSMTTNLCIKPSLKVICVISIATSVPK